MTGPLRGAAQSGPAVQELENALPSMARARARAPGFANHLIVLTDGRAHDLPDALAAVKRMPKGTRDREAIHNLVAVQERRRGPWVGDQVRP